MKNLRMTSHLLAVPLMILLGSTYAYAAIVTYTDKSAFLSDTGATNATGALPSLGLGTHITITIGTVTFEINRFGISDWSARLPGLELGVSNGVGGAIDDSIDATFASSVFSAGFDFVEPQFDPLVNSSFVDSTFQVNLKNGTTTVGSFTFNAPNDTAAFVGVWSDTAFNKLETRELVGSDGNEFYGEFFSGLIPLPEPTTAGVLGIMATAFFLRRR